MNKVLFLVLLVGVFAIHLVPAQKNLLVQTQEGKYRGTVVATGVRAFLGIPFAQPPVGNLRWKKAKAAKTFKGTRDATVSGNCCPQSGLFKNLTVVESEDCLTLDVYTPKKAVSGDKLQVKVYIHGGGFGANNAAIFPGDQLSANTSSVVVIINYRLSYQGFMVFTPLLKEGRGIVNYGITDQQLALQWIQKNIEQFGGDKDNVVIFGNSAGGMSVLMHYTIPTSKNLFKVGVSESAGPWNYITAKTAASLNDPLAARFGCYDSTSLKVNISCLREVPITSIYNYTWAAAQPVFDKLIPRPIAKSFANKAVMKKAKGGSPIIIGNAHYEGNQFAYLALRIVTRLPHPPLNATFQQFFGILNSSLPFNSTIINSVVSHYSNLSENGNYYLPLREALGDYGIKCGIAKTAYNGLKGLGAKVYNYFFQHDTVDWRYTFLNATHTVEIPYVLLTNGTLFETKFTADEVILAKRIAKYIGNFQDTKDPNKAKNNNPALPKVAKLPNWPEFKKSKNSTLAWDLIMSTIKLPVPAPCELYWNALEVDRPTSRRRSSDQETSGFSKFIENSELNLFHG
eukprot:TRINITY_DN8275_c0_g1_i1.p1 TRINITY_DN8275_c0_g1~~TRINITY_DN8275_c0_g1_i1.p1  ORF type:complete len:570 (-),score=113.53 TRINITY_DN8275_c0_g1_i1:109-1818(-)